MEYDVKGKTHVKKNQDDGRFIENLSNLETKYQILYEASKEAIMTLEPPSWKFTAGNPATLVMFKAKDEKEFISLTPEELSPEYQPDGTSSREKARAMIEKAMKEGSNFFEWMHKRHNGELFQATVLLTRMEIGGKSILQAMVRDVTEQKKLTEALIKANEEWQRTFDAVQDLIFLLNDEFVITKANKAFRDVLKLENEDPVGKKCYEVFHKINVPLPTCPFKKVLEDKKTHSEEIDDPNTGLQLLITVSPVFDSNGEVAGAVHIARDISEIKRMQQEDKKKIHDLELFHKIAVERELQMVKLKERIKELEKNVGDSM